MSNKRPLKAFVRYDGSGRAVSSSLIWRKNKPKVGNWKEVQGYECCDNNHCTLPYSVAAKASLEGNCIGYYSDRDLQNILGQCANPSLAIGAKFYLDNQFTTPAPDDVYLTEYPSILGYTVVNGIITDVGCP